MYDLKTAKNLCNDNCNEFGNVNVVLYDPSDVMDLVTGKYYKVLPVEKVNENQIDKIVYLYF